MVEPCDHFTWVRNASNVICCCQKTELVLTFIDLALQAQVQAHSQKAEKPIHFSIVTCVCVYKTCTFCILMSCGIHQQLSEVCAAQVFYMASGQVRHPMQHLQAGILLGIFSFLLPDRHLYRRVFLLCLVMVLKNKNNIFKILPIIESVLIKKREKNLTNKCLYFFNSYICLCLH